MEVVWEEGARDVKGLLVQVGQLDVGQQRTRYLIVEALQLQRGVCVLVDHAGHAPVVQSQALEQREVSVVPEGQAEEGGGAQSLPGVGQDGVPARDPGGGLAIRQEDDQRDPMGGESSGGGRRVEELGR